MTDKTLLERIGRTMTSKHSYVEPKVNHIEKTSTE